MHKDEEFMTKFARTYSKKRTQAEIKRERFESMSHMQRPIFIKIICSDDRHKSPHLLGGLMIDIWDLEAPAVHEWAGAGYRAGGTHLPLVDRPVEDADETDIVEDKKRGLNFIPARSAYRIYCDDCGRDVRIDQEDMDTLCHGLGQQADQKGHKETRIDLIDLSRLQSSRTTSKRQIIGKRIGHR